MDGNRASEARLDAQCVLASHRFSAQYPLQPPTLSGALRPLMLTKEMPYPKEATVESFTQRKGRV